MARSSQKQHWSSTCFLPPVSSHVSARRGGVAAQDAVIASTQPSRDEEACAFFFFALLTAT